MVDKIKYKGITIKIDHEDYSENPRDNDPPSVFAVYDIDGSYISNYDDLNECDNLYDEQYDDWSEKKIMTTVYKHYLFNMRVIAILPLHHHYHDGYNVNNCGKQIGFVYMTKKTWDSNFGDFYKNSDWYKKYHTGKNRKEIAELCIKSDVKDYNHWVNNEVYGFNIEYNDESSVSYWGFFGNDHEKSNLLPNARMEIDFYLKRKKEKKAKRLKRLIKSNVPLEHRTL
jgi:hypothetical protein